VALCDQRRTTPFVQGTKMPVTQFSAPSTPVTATREPSQHVFNACLLDGVHASELLRVRDIQTIPVDRRNIEGSDYGDILLWITSALGCH
jgi:hypothetical protein